jgi:hypothetical protein
MIMLHYRVIPDLCRQVQRAIAASAPAARQPQSPRQPCTAAANAPSRARLTVRPRSVRHRAAACTRKAPPGPATS